jgi:hypothetical protein
MSCLAVMLGSITVLLFCGVVGLKQFGVIRGAGHYHLDYA